MQRAETVLNVIRGRGRRHLPLERLYRQLFNPQLFLMAYGRLYSNAGATTPGVTGETVDGMSLAKIDAIIGALRSETYRWTPVKRVHIEKKGSRKKRPLGLPTWSDKIVADVVRLLLEAYYEPQFSAYSHGFRPGRGCHTALRDVASSWSGTRWFIEGDISDCFGSLDHETMLAILKENIHDGRFLRLIENMLRAGYLEDWRFNATLSGAPQGGVASPVLSNIYLDRLDQFVEQQLLPEYHRGSQRRANLAYRSVQNKIVWARKQGDRERVRALHRQLRRLPSKRTDDPDYRRLRYVRYADDWLLGFAGPKHEAEQIKERIREFLRDELALELSESKTLITHATSQAARFLGYEIRTLHADAKRTHGRRMINGGIGLFVPRDVLRQHCRAYMERGKPARRAGLIHGTDFSIVVQYQAEYRGLVQYYLPAQNIGALDTLHRVMEVSLLKTLAAKHKSSVSKMARRYKAVIDTSDGPRKGYRIEVPRDGGRRPLAAHFGGIPLRRQPTARLSDRAPVRTRSHGNELIHRLLAERCEACGARDGLVVHHIRKLADLHQPGRAAPPEWKVMMARRRRKTLVVCTSCHHDIHAGRADFSTRKKPLESHVSGN
ncbi:reverse transcriptase domain-containing protein [Streptomyces sp. KL116D]|uniref:reverse transcriptase/maturase family protein n=1 Tax=Streptomyces sp. KL116D TaxID=3045152 RepID=UPI003558F90B